MKCYLIKKTWWRNNLECRGSLPFNNVYIQVISSLGTQATVDIINLENTQQQTLILGRYAEGHGDHYMCLRQNELMGKTREGYEQESKADEDANTDPENRHP